MNTKKLWKEDLVVKVNKKNKPILVKGPDFEKEFETITDTIPQKKIFWVN